MIYIKGGVPVIPSVIFEAFKNIIFFALHVDNMGTFKKPLSKDEELKCFINMKEHNDQNAKNKLIEHNLRLVAHIIKKYYSKSKEQDELISIGTIGLIKAVSTFDYKKGTRLATYASKCIENELLMYFRSAKKSSGDIYIDDPIDSDQDGNKISLIDIISDGQNLIDKVEVLIDTQQVYKFIDECLNKREFQIICLRYGIYGNIPHTQKKVAQQLGISRSYVSRIEKKALQKLKDKYDKSSYC